MAKNPPASAGNAGSIPGSGRPREWLSTLIFLPGESHGQRSLAGYSPWGHKESDMAEAIEHVSEKNVKKNIYVFYT